MARVGIRDVAETAGVSIGTVSNYLNRPEQVSPDRALRVREAIEQLGFVPSLAGRQLRSGTSRVIGHMGTELNNPNSSAIALAAELRASELDISVFQVDSHGDPAREDRYLTIFEEHRVQGFLVSSVRNIEDRLALMRRRGTPSVMVGQRALSAEQPFVAIDDVAGGRLAAAHLLEIGCRRIAFVGGPQNTPQIQDRRMGAREAIDAHGGAMLEVLDTDQRRIADGYRVGQSLAARDPDARPHGIFAINDLLAVGILRGLVEGGVRVPEEIALIGYDDIDFAAASLVSLSTVVGRPQTFGAEVIDLLFDVITHKPIERHQRLIEPTLIVRESSRGFRRG